MDFFFECYEDVYCIELEIFFDLIVIGGVVFLLVCDGYEVFVLVDVVMCSV